MRENIVTRRTSTTGRTVLHAMHAMLQMDIYPLVSSCSHQYVNPPLKFCSLCAVRIEEPLPHVRASHSGQVGRFLLASRGRLSLPGMRVGRSSQLVRMLGMHCISLGNLHLQCLQLY